ncbi:hypothetical protein KXW98_001709 [Aspergillus fumigatus]|uniref:Cell wall protein n=2 Tax=Aspergillus fumigatus TaxID=746128 RepID=A4D9D0_ASPFU|nr:conserved hypothetical protein [Aspergillus fumigatus Af293]KAF4270049.1 hypothetical protein CNMCM8714_005388 [Aspergillus fumigatus]KMK60130.1 hypothetical protein Y699_01331 [Aspergillus fumigatus Z5]EBA27460.1 conserved hypothetical protein [Aspergillus fumigatus Af293]KAF4272710.1 hypothetical protein CNMCM8057_005978 [Aspergillus fumigatus]KAF4276126.1 hypothetical protein CNMCM8812_005335 [Aspergillus fumigatus]
MKFTGIVASLAVASSASALAIPQTPVDATLSKLNNALNNVEGLVGGLLGGVCEEVDLTQVQTELITIKGQLTKLVPVSATKRDVMSTANNVATPVTGAAGSELDNVEGAVKPVTNVAGNAVNTVEDVAQPVADVAGGAVGTVKNTVGGAVGTVENIASGPIDTVTGTAGVNTLAQNLVSKVKSGALDAAGVQNVLTTIGQAGGLNPTSLTNVLAGLL